MFQQFLHSSWTIFSSSTIFIQSYFFLISAPDSNYFLKASSFIYFFMVPSVCVCVCVCVYVCVCISFYRKGFSWLKQNKCNARDQASDVILRKLLCVKYLRRHVIDNHSRDLQASNYATVSIKPGRATGSKRQLLEILKTKGKSAKHSCLP